MGIRRARGFTLMEILVVVIIAAAVMGAGLYRVFSAQNQAIREGLQAEQIFALNTLYKAALNYVDGRRYLYAGNQKVAITVSELQAAQLLTTGWEGLHALNPGQTPFGQTYSIMAQRLPSGRMRVAVSESGAPDAGRRGKYRVDTAPTWLAYERELAALYRKRFNEDTYVLSATALGDTSYSLIPVSSSGTGVALTAAQIAAQPYPASAPATLGVLIVTTTAREDDATDDTVAVTANNTYTSCELVHSTNGPATCPSGKAVVTTLPTDFCLYSQAQLQQATAAGSVVLTVEEYLRSPDTTCGGRCSATQVGACNKNLSLPGGGCATTALTPDSRQSLGVMLQNGGYVRVPNSLVLPLDTIYTASVYLNGTRASGGYQCATRDWVSTGSNAYSSQTGAAALFTNEGAPPHDYDALCCVVTPVP